jgi:hypothetical protein
VDEYQSTPRVSVAGDPFFAAARLAKLEHRFDHVAPSCAECGETDLDLHQVPDNHLTFFEGDELCEACAINYGVL